MGVLVTMAFRGAGGVPRQREQLTSAMEESVPLFTSPYSFPCSLGGMGFGSGSGDARPDGSRRGVAAIIGLGSLRPHNLSPQLEWGS